MPYPEAEYRGKTVIVTGANVGLGREAARHFCRLGAARVILGCRDLDKGRAAGADIEESTSRAGVVDVWQLDLGSFESVRAFCRRAEAELDRLDVVIENAGVAIGTYVECDGRFESTIAINVVSTFYMALLLLPVLRRSAARHNVEPRVVVVSSDAHLFVRSILQRDHLQWQYPSGRVADIHLNRQSLPSGSSRTSLRLSRERRT